MLHDPLNQPDQSIFKQARFAVLVSGNGSNLQALIDQSLIPAVVISDQPHAQALQRAKDHGIPAQVLNPKDYASRLAYDQALLAALERYQPDLVVLAGFMRILSPVFVETYAGRLLNIHPSLLPHHKGLHTHERVLATGDPEHGCTVHFVSAELDAGPTIAQARFAVPAHASAEDLKQQVQLREHQLYPLCVRWFLAGQLQLRNTQVFLNQQALPKNGYFYDSTYKNTDDSTDENTDENTDESPHT